MSSNARFRDYLRDRETRRLESLSATLAEAYEQHGGNWLFLRDNAVLWSTYNGWQHGVASPSSRARAEERPPPHPGEPPPGRPQPGVGGTPAATPPADAHPHPSVRERMREALVAPPAMVVDVHDAHIVGPKVERSTALRIPIVTGAGTVGWLYGEEPHLAAPDLRFLEEQTTLTWTIAGLAVALAGLAAMALARSLLAPVKRLARATHRLAAGDYAGRVAHASHDELGQLVRDFNALADTLQRTEQMRREFLADVSHELRTPVAVLAAEIEALQDGVRSPTPEAVESLRAEVATLATLIDDLQQLASDDLGAPVYSMRPLDFGALVHTAQNAFAERLAARALAVSTAGLDREPLMVEGDPQRLTQLLNNLLENTLRYTDPGGRVRIALARAGSHAQLDVEDSAPGVPAAALARIFERLYRVERSRNRARGGSGLGLALCRSIAAAHHGDIDAVASSLGGLHVRLRLPLAAP